VRPRVQQVRRCRCQAPPCGAVRVFNVGKGREPNQAGEVVPRVAVVCQMRCRQCARQPLLHKLEMLPRGKLRAVAIRCHAKSECEQAAATMLAGGQAQAARAAPVRGVVEGGENERWWHKKVEGGSRSAVCAVQVRPSGG